LSLQVEYAIEAIKLGSTAIAIRTEEGIVMAVEKRITSPLMEPSSMDKIMEAGAYSFTSELNLSNSRTPS
jgi:20S proteasome subunit alpha 5